MMLWIILGAIIVCLLIKAFYTPESQAPAGEAPKQTQQQPVKAAKKPKQKAVSYDEWKKRTEKTARKTYKIRQSEYVTVPTEAAQRKAVKYGSWEVTDTIADAIMDGREVVTLKRSDWERMNIPLDGSE